MKQYLDLVDLVLRTGVVKEQRAVDKKTQQPLKARSIFGHQMRFDLADGFPLETAKHVPFSAIVAELLWFLSGSTNNNELLQRGARIWNDWAHPENGELGPIYGKQWRRWEAADGSKVDQIANLVRDIRAVIADPRASCGRRLIVSAWNPGDQDFPGPKPAPFACHTLFQCNVTDGVLSTHLYQRSADIFLGVPFNIACYSLLTQMLAQVTELRPGHFIHSFGDAHIYENHVEQCREMLRREPRALPRLELNPDIRELDAFTAADITISGYDPHARLPGDVAV